MSLSLLALLPLLTAAAPPPTLIFVENFDGPNVAGWTLGPEWEIGRVRTKSGHGHGNPDPERDHTGREGNGVAGVRIGGNAGSSPHSEPFWLTSPVIPVTGARQVTLHFERWLNSDQAPYMTNSVEVWNGTRWETVWQAERGERLEDSSWTHQSYDITPHQNAALRVRFGFSRQPGAFVGSSWNLDDVRVEAIHDMKASADAPWMWWGAAILAGLAFLPFRSSR
ncbi:MAG TPA: hypothetical protein VFQ91_24500 [Bryobacteraceae bacterium]|nr:hypothetical protein [Bryobacteraceae bacterium]